MPTAYTAESLDEMSYRDLQALAKDNKIRANQKADEMRKALKKTLSTKSSAKSSAKSSSSSTRKNKQTLLEKFPSEIVDKILLEKKRAEILPLLKKNDPHGSGDAWFDYDNVNVNAIDSSKKTLPKTIAEFKSQHIRPLVDLTYDLEDIYTTGSNQGNMDQIIIKIHTELNTLFQKFNIYFTTENIDEINEWIPDERKKI